MKGDGKGMCGIKHTGDSDRGTIERGGPITPSADVAAKAKVEFKINPWSERKCCSGEAKGYKGRG